jgi:hypothetical protein
MLVEYSRRTVLLFFLPFFTAQPVAAVVVGFCISSPKETPYSAYAEILASNKAIRISHSPPKQF